jgi:CDP-glucose 4,6-dehydratase
VLEPLNAYLMILRKQYEDSKYAGYYNIGPDDSGCISTGKLADMFCSKWEAATGRKLEWSHKQDAGPHESNFLKLDCSKLKTVFGWKPSWNTETAVDKTVEWTKAFMYREDVSLVMGRQWSEFLKGKQ